MEHKMGCHLGTGVCVDLCLKLNCDVIYILSVKMYIVSQPPHPQVLYVYVFLLRIPYYMSGLQKSTVTLGFLLEKTSWIDNINRGMAFKNKP